MIREMQMKVEMVIIINMIGFGSWSLVFGFVLVPGGLAFGKPKTKTQDRIQIFMFSIFLTISIPVTCRNIAAAIR